jgi:hypothetical protein
VRDEDDREAIICKAADELENLLSLRYTEGSRGLVKDDEF